MGDQNLLSQAPPWYESIPKYVSLEPANATTNIVLWLCY
jgi:hypothetical protein